MTPLEMTLLQLELECISLNESGRLCRIPGKNPDDIHKLFVVRYADGLSIFAREDVSRTTLNTLQLWDHDKVFSDMRAVSQLLSNSEKRGAIWQGSAYFFPGSYQIATTNVIQHNGRFSIFVDGVEVAAAWSSRSNEKCAELATETKAPHRRKGYARQVCCAWAIANPCNGLLPFYSHKLQNVASLRLARDLGVRHFMDCVSCE